MAAAMPDTVAAVTLVRVSMHREDERLLAVVAVHRAVNLQHRHAWSHGWRQLARRLRSRSGTGAATGSRWVNAATR